jgi:spermidine synthase
MTENWFRETLHPDVGPGFAMSEVVHSARTGFQEAVIFDNPTFGRILALDGAIQTTERDEFVYHEMLAHVPILAHGAARRVLIVGGGDGGCLRETLKHGAVERAVLVEIDGGVIELARRFLPSVSAGAFDDPRARVVVGDGARFVEESAERFDVIIVDSTDPQGPGAALFGDAFYAGCRRRLNPGGVLVTQNGAPFLQAEELRLGHARRARRFRDAACFLVAVPSYFGGLMALGWASDDAALRLVPAETLAARCREAGLQTRYYTPEVHRAAFALPGCVAALVA